MDEKKINEDLEFKYYVNIDWFPIKEIIKYRYVLNNSGIRKPEICKSIQGLYEVSDPFLFYCDKEDDYEYFVYYISLPEDNYLRIVKYRVCNSNDDYKTCIKSTTYNYWLFNMLSNFTCYCFNLIKPFDYDIYLTFTDPIFVLKDENSTICNIIANNNIIYISLGLSNNFLMIGKSNINFNGKAFVNFDKMTIEVFDNYSINGEIIRQPYSVRKNNLYLIESQTYEKFHVSVCKYYEETLSNHILIIDNDKLSYMLWINKPTYNVKINNKDMIFKDHILYNYFNEPISAQLASFIPTTNEIKPNYNLSTLDFYSICKKNNYQELYSIQALQRTIKELNILSLKKTIINDYASGDILIISKTFTPQRNLTCDIVESPDKVTNINKYHTIIYDEYPITTDNKKKIIQFINGECNFNDAGEKLFIFLLGPIGSGKSGMLRKVKNMYNMSGKVFLAQIDKLVEEDLEYMIFPNETLYFKLRKEIYNEKMNSLITSAMNENSSIILETTHVDIEYLASIRERGYKLICCLFDETFENISNNIEIRNKTKIRKTTLSLEDYNKFYTVNSAANLKIHFDSIIKIIDHH
jgi:hypothetical protein